jgi:PTH1 family peptidyl-tRNA hydrolase
VRAIFGIGNPGVRYQRTRHNAGFLMLDSFVGKQSVEFKPAKGDYYFARGEINQVPYFLIKPTTYVNMSGLAALQFLEEYKIGLNDLLILCDDVNIKVGKLRIRKNGGDGGHNGLASLIYHFNSNEFPRLRIGVGDDSIKEDLLSYVLGDFSHEQFDILLQTFKKSDYLLNEFIRGGLKAMLDANSKIFNNDSAINNN